MSITLAATLLLGLAAAVPASASASRPVQIDLRVVFDGGETFTATGFCPSGTAASYGFYQAGFGVAATTFHLLKDLTCADGSGTLTIRVDVGSVFDSPGTIGGWSVVGGTGEYAAARGGGMIVGIAFDDGIDDRYTGRLTR